MPFETKILGVVAIVERVDLNRSEQIVAVCSRGRDRQSLPILDLPLPARCRRAPSGSRRTATGG